MSARSERIEPTHEWHQLEFRIRADGQRAYELIRPVVLFGHSPAERAAETGAAERTLYRQVARFAQLGMASCVPPPKVEKHRTLPPQVRQAIVDLKREHPPLNVNEIRTICWARFAHRPSSATVKRVLAEDPPAPRAHRRFPPFQRIADPVERRLAIVRLHIEGWNKQSIARYLECNRGTVHETLRRWIAEGVAGLDNKSSAPHRPATKVTLKAIATVKELQENSLLGQFRVHAALKRLGIFLSPSTCGRILALNRALYGLPKPERTPREPKAMPFAARRRHQYWTADIRYLDHGLGDFKVYAITLLDNYSRAIVASGLSRTQDLSAFLIVFYMAIRQHGAPEALVTDSGGVFLAKEARRIYAALDIRKEEIDRRQPWQSYIETAFGVQRRMADWAFARAGTWPELLAVHDQWVADYNYQDHFAHRHRPEDRRSPAAVLHTICGRLFAPEELHRIFYTTRFGRVLDRAGYIRFRRWRVYAERGLPGAPVAVWLYAEHLTLVYRDEPLAQYRVTYQPDRRRLKTVTEERVFETPHRAPQPPLWAWGEGEWLRVLRLPEYAPRQRPHVGAYQQPPLFALGLPGRPGRVRRSNGGRGMIHVVVRPRRVYLERGEHRQQLNCDFLLESRAARPLHLDTIEVSVFDAHGLLVLRRALDANALNPSIATVGTTALAPGEALTVFNPFHTFPANLPLDRLRYWFVFVDGEGRPAANAEAEVVPTRYATRADLILPVRGRLIVWDGHDFYAHHRRVALTHPLIRELGVEALSGRYAYDFDVVDERGALHRGDGAANADWFGFGAPVLAPGDGAVVLADDAMPDNDVGNPAFAFAAEARRDLRRINGNHVILDHGTGEYSLLCHLQQGSVVVRPGERVRQGQPLARLGNSGATTHVHLHYELADGYDMRRSEGLPAYFRRYRLRRGARTTAVAVGIPDTGDIVESAVP